MLKKLLSADTASMLSGPQRLPLIDVLRGFTLAGIFFIHMDFVFSGWLPGSSLGTLEVDEILHYLVVLLIKDKFRTLFCLLFGISFYLQLRKFENNPGAFTRNFLKRTGLLLFFGMVHGYLLWYGDVLRYYALASILLLILFRLPTRWLLASGIFFANLIPVLATIIQSRSGAVTLPDTQWETAWLTLKNTSSYWEMLKANATISNHYIVDLSLSVVSTLTILGNFLLGVWVAKTGLLHRLKTCKPYFNRIISWSLAAGVSSGLLVLGLTKLQYQYPSQLYIGDLVIICTYLNINGLLVFYVSAIMKLFNNVSWQPRLMLLAPAGRTTLSNYVAQSIMGVFIFYPVGLGWEGQLGPSVTLPLTAVLFALQVIVTNWWLRHFKQGPLEWIWRMALTETKPLKGTSLATPGALKRVA